MGPQHVRGAKRNRIDRRSRVIYRSLFERYLLGKNIGNYASPSMMERRRILLSQGGDGAYDPTPDERQYLTEFAEQTRSAALDVFKACSPRCAVVLPACNGHALSLQGSGFSLFVSGTEQTRRVTMSQAFATFLSRLPPPFEAAASTWGKLQPIVAVPGKYDPISGRLTAGAMLWTDECEGVMCGQGCAGPAGSRRYAERVVQRDAADKLQTCASLECREATTTTTAGATFTSSVLRGGGGTPSKRNGGSSGSDAATAAPPRDGSETQGLRSVQDLAGLEAKLAALQGRINGMDGQDQNGAPPAAAARPQDTEDTDNTAKSATALGISVTVVVVLVLMCTTVLFLYLRRPVRRHSTMTTTGRAQHTPTEFANPLATYQQQ